MVVLLVYDITSICGIIQIFRLGLLEGEFGLCPSMKCVEPKLYFRAICLQRERALVGAESHLRFTSFRSINLPKPLYGAQNHFLFSMSSLQSTGFHEHSVFICINVSWL